MIPIFIVKKNSDTVEGRGPMIVDCVFTKKEDAEAYIDPKPGLMGRYSEKGWSKEPYGDWVIEPSFALESILEKVELDNNLLREKALKNLTPEERTILGLA